MNQNELRHLEAEFSGSCGVIAVWDKTIARRHESATKRVYVEALGWDWVQELRQKRAWLIGVRLAMARELARHGVTIKKMDEYAARANNPMCDPA